jgi:hypothetical protein
VSSSSSHVYSRARVNPLPEKDISDLASGTTSAEDLPPPPPPAARTPAAATPLAGVSIFAEAAATAPGVVPARTNAPAGNAVHGRTLSVAAASALVGSQARGRAWHGAQATRSLPAVATAVTSGLGQQYPERPPPPPPAQCVAFTSSLNPPLRRLRPRAPTTHAGSRGSLRRRECAYVCVRVCGVSVCHPPALLILVLGRVLAGAKARTKL